MRYNVNNLICSEEEIDFMTLRFMHPSGDIYLSKENHIHSDLLKEDNLSDKEGFDGLLDLVQRGYALLSPLQGDVLMVSHMKLLTEAQNVTVKLLKEKFGCEMKFNYEETF